MRILRCYRLKRYVGTGHLILRNAGQRLWVSLRASLRAGIRAALNADRPQQHPGKHLVRRPPGHDLTKAEQELNALKSQAGPFAAQANQLSNALNAIKTNAAALAKSPTPTNLTNLTNSVTSFKSTADPLIKEMRTACP